MDECLNCGTDLVHIEGRRKKKFCNSGCRATYHYNQNGGKKKYVRIETYDKVVEELNNLKITSAKISKENGNPVAKFEIEIPDTQTVDTERQKRINQLGHELKYPPTKFSSLLAKQLYFHDRKRELASLNKND